MEVRFWINFYSSFFCFFTWRLSCQNCSMKFKKDLHCHVPQVIEAILKKPFLLVRTNPTLSFHLSHKLWLNNCHVNQYNFKLFTVKFKYILFSGCLFSWTKNPRSPDRHFRWFAYCNFKIHRTKALMKDLETVFFS